MDSRIRGAAWATLVLLLAPDSSSAAFTESASAYGLDIGLRMSWGASFADYDGDGDPDLYIGNHWELHPDLLRNDGGTAFTSNNSHFLGFPYDRHDQLWADLDGNGTPDHYLIHGGSQPSELFWNQGDGTFLEGAVAANADDAVGSGLFGRGREMTMADFDLDGDLDVYIANAYRSGFPQPSVFLSNDGDATFTRISVPTLDKGWPRCSGADYDLDGLVDLIVTNPFDDDGYLFRNTGAFGWTDVTATAFPGIVEPLRRANALSWGDYDEDGDLDLFAGGGDGGRWDYAAIEGDSLRYYFICTPGQIEIASVVTDADSVELFGWRSDFYYPRTYYGGGGSSTNSYPVTLAVADLAGFPPDLVPGNRAVGLWTVPGVGADTLHLACQADSFRNYTVGGDLKPIGGTFWNLVTQNFDPPPAQAGGDLSSHLYRNEGDGTFSDVTSTALAGDDSTANTNASTWVDYDNDGRLDLFLADGGTVETGNQPNRLYRNNGDGTFTDVAAVEGVTGTIVGMTAGGCWGDVDGDGFLDLFTGNGLESPPFGVGPRELFLNTPNGNHWIELALRSGTNNGSGIGARVRVVGATGVRHRTLRADADNAFSDQLALHVGLGSDTVVDSLEIRWPSGTVDTHLAVAADRRLVAVEGDSLRTYGAPALIVSGGPFAFSINAGDADSGPFALESPSAEAIRVVATAEDCTGSAVTWLWATIPEPVIWPGDAAHPATVHVNAAALLPGTYCGRVILTSNAVAGPDTIDVTVEVAETGVGVRVGSLPPATLELTSPRPNPVRGRAISIDLGLPSEGPVDVEVIDLAGRSVRGLASGVRSAGWHRVDWDLRERSGQRVAPGVYWIRALTGGESRVRKVVVLE